MLPFESEEITKAERFLDFTANNAFVSPLIWAFLTEQNDRFPCHILRVLLYTGTGEVPTLLLSEA